MNVDAEVYFHLYGIPEHILFEIIIKMKPKAFIKFCRTSKSMYRVSMTHPHSIHLKLENISAIRNIFMRERQIPHSEITFYPGGYYHDIKHNLTPFRLECDILHIVIIDGRESANLSPETAEELLTLCDENKIHCRRIGIICKFNGLENYVKRILKQVQPKHVTISPAISKNDFPARKIFLITTDYGNEDFLSLRAEKMIITCPLVTSYGIHTFLQEWIEGRRSLRCMTVIVSNQLEYDIVVNKLPFRCIYNQAKHEGSIFRNYNIHEMSFVDQDQAYYSIRHEEKNYLMHVYFHVYDMKTRIELDSCEDPVDMVVQRALQNSPLEERERVDYSVLSQS